LYLVNSVTFSPNGTQDVSGSHDKTVRLWDATTGAQVKTLEGHLHGITSVAFSPNGTQVISGARDPTVRLWNAAIGALLETLKGHSSYVSSVVFSPNGTQVVDIFRDETVGPWDAAIGALLETLQGHSSFVTLVAFSPDGKLPSLFVSKRWISKGLADILWLPPDYRPTCIAIWDEIIVIGHSLGKISFLQLKKGPKLII
jgi:WD40 repeat protein